MPIVFGEPASSVNEILPVLRKHGDEMRGVYRSRYRFDLNSSDPYATPSLERPASLRDNPSTVVYPWEQVFVAAAACAGSDYPMLAAHAGIPLERVEFIVEGVFDPRGEFDGLSDFEAPADARQCFLALHFSARLVSHAPRAMRHAPRWRNCTSASYRTIWCSARFGASRGPMNSRSYRNDNAWLTEAVPTGYPVVLPAHRATERCGATRP
jgi:hypothetical protein